MVEQTEAQLLEQYATAPEASPRGDWWAAGTRNVLAREILAMRGVYVRENETIAGLHQLVAESATLEGRQRLTTVQEKEYPGIYERRPAYAGKGPEREAGVPTSYVVVDGRKVYEGSEEFQRLTGEQPTPEDPTVVPPSTVVPPHTAVAPVIEPPEERRRTFTEIIESGRGLSVAEIRDIVVAKTTVQPLKEIRAQRGTVLDYTYKAPAYKSTIRPEIEAYKELRGERAAEVTKETLIGFGEASVELGAMYAGGAVFGAGLRAIRAVQQLQKVSKGVEISSAFIFAGVTGIEVGRGVKAGDPGMVAETLALASAGVAGAIKGYGKAAPLEAIGPGTRALKGVRPSGKVTAREKIQLGLGRRAEVPKTTEEALALQKALGPRPIAEVATVDVKGEFEPIQVGEITTIIGGKKFTRPRFEEIAPLEAGVRKFEKGAYIETELAPETGFKEITTTKIFEFKEKGKVYERPVLRREEWVGEELLSVRELIGRARRRGFLGEEAGEVLGKTKPFEEVSPGKIVDPKIKAILKPSKPRIKSKVDIYDVGIGPKLRPIAITTGLTKGESKALAASVGIAKYKARPISTALPKVDTKLKARARIVPDVRAPTMPKVITGVSPGIDTGIGWKPFVPLKPAARIDITPVEPTIKRPTVSITLPKFDWDITDKRKKKRKKKKVKKGVRKAPIAETPAEIKGLLKGVKW